MRHIITDRTQIELLIKSYFKVEEIEVKGQIFRHYTEKHKIRAYKQKGWLCGDEEDSSKGEFYSALQYRYGVESGNLVYILRSIWAPVQLKSNADGHLKKRPGHTAIPNNTEEAESCIINHYINYLRAECSSKNPYLSNEEHIEKLSFAIGECSRVGKIHMQRVLQKKLDKFQKSL